MTKQQLKVTGNNMQDFSFVSESYSKRKPKDCRLSISIRRDGFSFLILYKQNIEAFAYKTVAPNKKDEEFKNFLDQEILQSVFASVTIIVVSQKFTLVPKKFYDDSLIEQYSELNFTASEQESIINYESEKNDVVVLFPIEQTIWTLCRSAFKEQNYISYVPQVAPLLEANCKTRKEKLCISIENNFFTAMYIKGKELHFCNSFRFANVNDFTFFVMNIFDKLHLDTINTPVELSGIIGEKSPYFSALQVFIKNLSIAKSEDFPEKFPYMLFYNHSNVDLCE